MSSPNHRLKQGHVNMTSKPKDCGFCHKPLPIPRKAAVKYHDECKEKAYEETHKASRPKPKARIPRVSREKAQDIVDLLLDGCSRGRHEKGTLNRNLGRRGEGK